MPNVIQIELAVDDKGTAKLKSFSTDAAKAFQQAGKEATKSSAAFKEIADQAGKAGLALTAFGAVGTAAIAKSFQTFSQFETEIANVNTLLGGAGVAIGPLREQLLGLDSNLGSSTELAKGLYQAISSGAVPAAEAVGLVETAAQFAKAGLTDTFSAVDVLTTAVANFRSESLTASQASDVLFQAVKEGKTTAEELASNLGKVAPAAAALKVPFGDLSAAIAQVTAGGLDTARATTSLAGAMADLRTPTESTGKLFKQLDIDVGEFQAKLSTRGGLVAALQELQVKAEAAGLSLADFFQRESLVSIDILAQDFDKAAAASARFADAQRDATATAEALAKQLDTPKARLDAMSASLEKLQIAAGGAVAPAITKMAESATHLVDAFLQLDKGTQEFVVQSALAASGASLAAGSFGLLLSKIPDMVKGFNVLKAVTVVELAPGFGTLAGAMNLLPFAAIVGGGAAVVGALRAWNSALDDLNASYSRLNDLSDPNKHALASASIVYEELTKKVSDLRVQLEKQEKQLAEGKALGKSDFALAGLYNRIQDTKKALESTQGTLDKYQDQLNATAKATREAGQATASTVPPVVDLGTATGQSAEALKKAADAAKAFKASLNSLQVKSLETDLAKLTGTIVSAAGEIDDQVLDQVLDLLATKYQYLEAAARDSAATEEEAALKAIAVQQEHEQAIQDLGDAIGEDLSKANDKAGKAVKKLTKDLDTQHDVLTQLEQDIADIEAAAASLSSQLGGVFSGGLTGQGSFTDFGTVAAAGFVGGFRNEIERSFDGAVRPALQQEFVDLFGPTGITRRALGPLSDSLQGLFTSALAGISDPVEASLGGLFDSITSPLSSIVSKLGSSLISPLSDAIGKGISSIVAPVTDYLGTMVGDALGGIASAVGSEAFGGAADGISGALGGALASAGPVAAVAAAVGGITAAVINNMGGPSETTLMTRRIEMITANAVKGADWESAVNVALEPFGLAWSKLFEQSLSQAAHVGTYIPEVLDEATRLLVEGMNSGNYHQALVGTALLGGGQLSFGAVDVVNALFPDADDLTAEMTSFLARAVAQVRVEELGVQGPKAALAVENIARGLILYADRAGFSAQETLEFVQSLSDATGAADGLFLGLGNLNASLDGLPSGAFELLRTNLVNVIQTMTGWQVPDNFRTFDQILSTNALSAEEFGVALQQALDLLPPEVRALVYELNPGLTDALQDVTGEADAAQQALTDMVRATKASIADTAGDFSRLLGDVTLAGLTADLQAAEDELRALGSDAPADVRANAQAVVDAIREQLAGIAPIIDVLNDQIRSSMSGLLQQVQADGTVTLDEAVSFYRQYTDTISTLGDNLSESTRAALETMLITIAAQANTTEAELAAALGGMADDAAQVGVAGEGAAQGLDAMADPIATASGESQNLEARLAAAAAAAQGIDTSQIAGQLQVAGISAESLSAAFTNLAPSVTTVTDTIVSQGPAMAQGLDDSTTSSEAFFRALGLMGREGKRAGDEIILSQRQVHPQIEQSIGLTGQLEGALGRVARNWNVGVSVQVDRSALDAALRDLQSLGSGSPPPGGGGGSGGSGATSQGHGDVGMAPGSNYSAGGGSGGGGRSGAVRAIADEVVSSLTHGGDVALLQVPRADLPRLDAILDSFARGLVVEVSPGRHARVKTAGPRP